jgi:fructosamine-3-kinase
MFYHWLNDRHGARDLLTGIALDKFTDNVMVTLVDADSCESAKHTHESSSSKGSGLSLPTSNGNQSQYKVWNQKWSAYLGTMYTADSVPLLHVIVRIKHEKQSARHQI